MEFCSKKSRTAPGLKEGNEIDIVAHSDHPAVD
jgi:hypothetical protein